jgi:diguanylate cyclase (GGDEF)-like protein
VVLLFVGYAIYQQTLLKRLRRKLSAQLVTVATLEKHADEFYRLAVQDALTGLYNRRYAMGRLEAEIARAQRMKHPLMLVLLDLNDFKPINDQYGHAAGDLVLAEFAQRLRRASRGSDLPARIGGDEFMVLLPECPPERVENMLSRVSGLHVNLAGTQVPIRYSAGWAQYQDGDTPDRLQERADQALYATKRRSKGELSAAAAPASPR